MICSQVNRGRRAPADETAERLETVLEDGESTAGAYKTGGIHLGIIILNLYLNN